MKIPLTLQPLIDATRRPLPSLLDQLKVGQVLQAKVLEQPQIGLLRLQIATTELLARSRVQIQAGTPLKLEVVKGGTLPELKILRQAGPREQQQQLVRTAFPRQMPPVEVRQAITSLKPQAEGTRLAEPLRQFNAISQASGVRVAQATPLQINPPQIQRALQLSGILHEARVITGMPLPAGDTKAQLLQLLTLLKPELKLDGKNRRPPTVSPEQPTMQRAVSGDALLNRLIRLIEGSISRIQLQQAAALPQDDSPRQAWQIDLPIHLSDETHEAMLRIEREGAANDAESATWSVNLVFQFDTIGRLQCRIGLDGDRVSATFWCEKRTTLDRVDQGLGSLQAALEAQGLEVVHVAGVLGEPSEPLVHVPMPDYLLDEHV